MSVAAGSARRWLPLVLIVLLATFVRVRGIADDSLWGDENLSVFIARMPLPEIMPNVAWREQIPPLHHFILHFWIKVFGDRETAVRMPSAVAGVVAVMLMYGTTRRMLGRREAIAAALLLAVAPLFVEYSQEARTYELAFALAVASTGLFVRVVRGDITFPLSRYAGRGQGEGSAQVTPRDESLQQREPSPQPSPGVPGEGERAISGRSSARLEAAYAIVTALMLYAHIYGIFVVAAHQLAYVVQLIARRGKATPTLPRWIAMTFATALLFSPYVPTVMQWTRAVQVNFWVKEVTWHDISRAYWVYCGSTPMYVLAVALTVLGVVRVWRRRREVLPLMLLVMLLPVVIPVIVSILTRPAFAPRYGMFACVGFFPLIAAGVTALPWKWLRGLTLAAILVLGVTAINGEAVNVPKSPWRPAMKWLNEQMRPGDKAVVHIKAMTRTYDYYMPRDPSQRRGFDTSALPINPDALAEPDERVWFVLYGQWAPPRDMLRRGPWFVRSRKWFDDILIMELDNTIPEGAEPWAKSEPATMPALTQ